MIYLYYGDEYYLIREAVNSLKEKFKDHALENYNQTPVKELCENIQSQSLFSPSRLMLAYRVDFDEDEDDLVNALINLAPGIELVFISPQNLDGRKKIVKFINEKGKVEEFKSFADWEEEQVVEWAVKKTASISKKLSRRAAELLVEISGKNLTALSSEIEKLAVYTGDKQEITEEDVELLAGKQEAHIFSFVDALKEKNAQKAFAIEEKIQINRDPVVPIISMIESQFKTLLLVKMLLAQHWDKFKIARALGYSPFYINKCIVNSSGFSIQKLRSIMEALYQSDRMLKKGGSPKAVLPLLLKEICCG